MPEVTIPALVGDAGAADRVIAGLGCARCRTAKLGLTGRKFAPCPACARMVASSPGNLDAKVNAMMQPGSMIADALKRAGWVFVAQALVSYLARNTRAPWLRVQWSAARSPDLVEQLSNKTESVALQWSSWGKKDTLEGGTTFHVPLWLSQLLNAGTVMRKAKLNGGRDGLDWPRVLTHFTEHPTERAPLQTVIVLATSAVEPLTDVERMLGVEPKATIDPVPIASFIRDGWPHLIGAR